MKNFPLGAALVAGLSLVQPVSGALLIVNNPSFEAPAIAAGTFDTSAPPVGWSTYGYVDVFAGRDVGVLDPATTTLYSDPVPDGDNVAVVFLLTGGPTESGLQQTLADTLQTGMTYTLNVHVGNISPPAPRSTSVASRAIGWTCWRVVRSSLPTTTRLRPAKDGSSNPPFLSPSGRRIRWGVNPLEFGSSASMVRRASRSISTMCVSTPWPCRNRPTWAV